MSQVKREQSIEFVCIGTCEEDDRPTYMVEGRFNAEGEFEVNMDDENFCPECGEPGEPMDSDVRVADV